MNCFEFITNASKSRNEKIINLNNQAKTGKFKVYECQPSSEQSQQNSKTISLFGLIDININHLGKCIITCTKFDLICKFLFLFFRHVRWLTLVLPKMLWLITFMKENRRENFPSGKDYKYFQYSTIENKSKSCPQIESSFLIFRNQVL